MTAKHRSRPGDQPRATRVPTSGICEHCGKIRYDTRKQAKSVARQLSRHDLAAYECDGYFHLGHLPDFVKNGAVTRDQLLSGG